MKRIVKKHPLAIRWFHWINFPILAVMIWSGFMIYWANDVYRLGWGNTTLLKFFRSLFIRPCNLNTNLPAAWPFILFSCGYLPSMAYYIFYTPFFLVNGNILCPISILSKKHGRYYCMICACVKQRHHKKNIMLLKKLPILLLWLWDWVLY